MIVKYSRVVTAHNGYLVRDKKTDTISEPFVFDFEGNTAIDHIFRDGRYYFVSEELKDSIESSGLAGVAFSSIETTHDSGTGVDRRFYEMVFLEGTDSPDFYLYDQKKIAASPKGILVLKAAHCDVDIIDLNGLSYSEQFLAEFKEEQKKAHPKP